MCSKLKMKSGKSEKQPETAQQQQYACVWFLNEKKKAKIHFSRYNIWEKTWTLKQFVQWKHQFSMCANHIVHSCIQHGYRSGHILAQYDRKNALIYGIFYTVKWVIEKLLFCFTTSYHCIPILQQIQQNRKSKWKLDRKYFG